MSTKYTAKATYALPCPRCGHGKNGGHKGRHCSAIVYRGADREPDRCGCTYEGRR